MKSSKYPISATFIDEVSFDIPHLNWTKKQWIKDLKAMKSVGIDTIIFIRGGIGYKCIFPSKNFHSYYTEDNDFFGYMLEACEKLKINVYVGLYMSTINWDNGNYQKMHDQNAIFIDEVMERYGKYKNLVGFYIPTEVGMDEFNIIPTLEKLTNLIKTKVPDKKIYFCPLFRTRIYEKLEDEFTYEQTYDVWDKILSTMGHNIDAISFTDGTAPLFKLEGYMKATKEVADKYGIEYWSNVELFDRVQPTQFEPIQFEILKEKLELHKKYSVKLNSFEFSHFMSPNSPFATGKNLFSKYKKYYKNK